VSRRIGAVAVDLFGTLVWIDQRRYPSVIWLGQRRASSAPVLHEALLSWMPDLDLQTFIAASIAVQDELEALRRETGREYPLRDRFRLVFERSGIDPGLGDGIVLRSIMRLHKDRLLHATRLFPGTLYTVASIARHRPVVLVSNFDDGDGCRRIIDERGLTPYLSGIVVSEDLGWRKPDRRLFERAAAHASVPPEEILFVGDSPVCDVDGARGCGMMPVWIRGAEVPDPSWTPPGHVIQRIEEVLDLPGI
jgi:FMN phosphatase YigB (HAD superfamily)